MWRTLGLVIAVCALHATEYVQTPAGRWIARGPDGVVPLDPDRITTYAGSLVYRDPVRGLIPLGVAPAVHSAVPTLTGPTTGAATRHSRYEAGSSDLTALALPGLPTVTPEISIGSGYRPRTTVPTPTPTDAVLVRVTGVHDGDTIEVTDASGQARSVRLDAIDAPELAQPGGDQSRDFLAQIVRDEYVMFTQTGTDRFGRALGRITWSGIPLNDYMVEKGWAWHFGEYAPSRNDLATSEAAARQSGAGLWSSGTVEAPWDYRRRMRAANVGTVISAPYSPGTWGGGESGVSRSRAPAGNGDVYGVDNDGDGRAETVYVREHYRDGRYYPSSYRAPPSPSTP